MDLFVSEVRRCLLRRMTMIMAIILAAIYSIAYGVMFANSVVTGSRFRIDEGLDNYVFAWNIIFIFALLIWGGSMVGAEWSSGNMANLLLWHPNRLKLWFTKLLAITLIGTIGMIIFMIVVIGSKFIYAAALAEVGNLPAEWWSVILSSQLRTLLLAAMMATLGAALAMWGRHTSVASTVAAGYVILDPILTWIILGAVFNLTYPSLFSLFTYGEAWLQSGVSVMPVSGDAIRQVSMLTGLGVLAAVIAFIVFLATRSFIRRSV